MSSPTLAAIEASPGGVSSSSDDTLVSPQSSTRAPENLPAATQLSPSSSPQPHVGSLPLDAGAMERVCDALALQVVRTEQLLFDLCGQERGLAALARHRATSAIVLTETRLCGHMKTQEEGAASLAIPRQPSSTTPLPSAAPATPQDVDASRVDAAIRPATDAALHRSAPLKLPSTAPGKLLHISSSCVVPPQLHSPAPSLVQLGQQPVAAPLSPTNLYPGGPPPRLVRPAIWNFSAQVLAWVVGPTGRRPAPKVRLAPQMSLSRVSPKWLRATSALDTNGGMMIPSLPDRHPCRIRLEIWDDRRGGQASEPLPGSVRSVTVDALLDVGLYDSLLILAHDFIDSQAGRLEEEESWGETGRERKYYARFEALGDFRTEVKAENKVTKTKDKAGGVKRTATGEGLAVGGSFGAGHKRMKG